MSAQGHIRQRPSGSWAVVLPVKQRDGSTKSRWFTAGKTKESAERLRARLVHELAEGTYLDASAAPLSEYLEDWLRYLTPRRRPQTLSTYRAAIGQHLGPALGRVPLSKLTGRQVEEYYARLLSSGRKDGRGGLSPTTVRLHDILLRAALKQAVKWKLLAVSPMEDVEPPGKSPFRGKALGKDELRRLMEVCRETSLELPVLLALFCGLRRSEVLGLAWSEVDFDGARLSVRASKSEAGVRSMSIPPFLVAALKRQRQRTARAVGPVVVRQDGRPFRDASSLTDAFGKMLARAGLPHMRFHDLKHTCATTLLMGGLPLKMVSSRVGHATTAITLDIYGHTLTEHDEAAAAWMEEQFGTGG